MSRSERSGFDTTLRFELASEEDRPLFVSYFLASALALAWLALVHTMPRPILPPFVDPGSPTITFEPLAPAIERPMTARVNEAGRAVRQRAAPAGSPEATSLINAFSGTPGLVDAGRLLRGVDITPGGARAGEPSKKVGLETGVGSRTPGRVGDRGLSSSGAGLGTVVGGGVSRNAVTIAPPEVRTVSGATTTGITSEVGQTARAHVPQLERCYHQEGLSRNPALAGLVRLGLTVQGGRVTSAHVVDRTWAGAGAAEAESCLVRTARGWRLGGADAQIVLPLSFTSPRR